MCLVSILVEPLLFALLILLNSTVQAVTISVVKVKQYQCVHVLLAACLSATVFDKLGLQNYGLVNTNQLVTQSRNKISTNKHHRTQWTESGMAPY